MHKPEEIYNSSDIQNDTLPQRKLLKHLSVAQHLFLLCFCCSDFVYSSLSQSASFILSCLNLFLTTVIPSTQKNERNSQWKTQSFHLGHESITRAVFLNTLHVGFFVLERSEDRPLDWREGCIDSDMFISMAKTCCVSNKTSTFGSCCSCVCWSTPSNFYGWVF